MIEKPKVTLIHTGKQDGHGKDEAEVARLTDVFATGAIGDSTRKEYNGRFRTFATFRAARGKGPWLLEKDGVEEAVRELTTFMSYRCFVLKNQSQTVRGYLSAIKFFHKMYAGWELPTTHFILSRRCPLLATSCPSFSVCFPCSSPIPGLIWFGFVYLVTTAGFVADQLM